MEMNVRDGEIDYKLSKERSKEAIIINSFIQLEKDMRKEYRVGAGAAAAAAAEVAVVSGSHTAAATGRCSSSSSSSSSTGTTTFTSSQKLY